MAKILGYEVIDHDEVTVHKTVAKLPQSDGSTFYQNGMGRTYLLGEVIPPAMVADDWKLALEEGEDNPLYEHVSKKLKAVTDAPREDIAARLGLPFPGYDDMDANEVVSAMHHLPSATIQKIKAYETTRGADARTEIVDYNIGYGEHPDTRQLTELEDPETYDEDKAVRRLTTREVPEDGLVRPGEGITGTGDPQKGYGTTADANADDADDEAKGDEKTNKVRGSVADAKRRAGRRGRAPKPAAGKGEGPTSIETTNSGNGPKTGS